MKMRSKLIPILAGLALSVGATAPAFALTDFSFNGLLNTWLDTDPTNAQPDHTQQELTLVGKFSGTGGVLTNFEGYLGTAAAPNGHWTVTPLALGPGNTFGTYTGTKITTLNFLITNVTGANEPFTDRFNWRLSCQNNTGGGNCSNNVAGTTISFQAWDLATNTGAIPDPDASSGGRSNGSFALEVPEIDGGALSRALLLIGSALLVFRKNMRSRKATDGVNLG